MTRPPVIVVGPGRSGTSAVARLLHEQLGVSMGGDWQPGGAASPEGTYEDAELCRLLVDLVERRTPVDAWDRLIPRYLARRAAAGSPWGFKAPLLAHVWRRLGRHVDFPQCLWVRTRRAEHAVLASWARCYDVPAHRALALVRYRERELDELQAATAGARWLELDMSARHSDEVLREVLEPFLAGR